MQVSSCKGARKAFDRGLEVLNSSEAKDYGKATHLHTHAHFLHSTTPPNEKFSQRTQFYKGHNAESISTIKCLGQELSERK